MKENRPNFFNRSIVKGRQSRILLVLGLFFVAMIETVQATPFPITSKFFDKNNQPVGAAHIFPRYIEIFNNQDEQVGKVGILVQKGRAVLFLVSNDEGKKPVGYARNGEIFDRNDKKTGRYEFFTLTWAFIYDTKGGYAGKVQCLAWPLECAAGVGGYLLNLFGKRHGTSP